VEVGKTLYVVKRSDWRQWLEVYYKTEPEIWLQFYRKESGKPRISYNDAVEEALCFGWIDSIVKKLDEESFVQRFSPRNPKTAYSQLNKERLRKLVNQGLVVVDVLATLGNLSPEAFEIPQDILQAIQANEDAWKHFQEFSDQYKRIRVAFIDGSRIRPDVFERRLNYFIKKTAANKQFGYGGTEEYF
jgi:uncharacterized protein YdeI (YjbR/CyaY-like superfamily)